MRRAGLLAVGLLGACVASRGAGVRPLRPLELATAPYQEAITASFTGNLTYEGGCLWFRDDRTRGRLLPVWPTGSTFNGTAVTFHQPGKEDQPIVVGEEFMMEGRPLPWSSLPVAAYAPFQHQCGAQPFFVSKVRPAD